MTYAHEHLLLDNTLIERCFPEIHLPDIDAAVSEVNECAAAGVMTMVDAMPCAAGRNVVGLAEVSRQTGVAVVAATGLHHERYYGPQHWTATATAEQLASLFTADAVEGIDRYDYSGPLVERTTCRAGLVKVATGTTISQRDRKVIEAAAQTAVTTGVPILTHCEKGALGLEQVELFAELGVPSSRLILSHVDKINDYGYHHALAETGAWLEYDQGLRSAKTTVGLIEHLASLGLSDRIVLGTDGARRSLWRAYGGEPGLAWLASTIPTLLRSHGLEQGVIDALFVTNPALALQMAVPEHQ